MKNAIYFKLIGVEKLIVLFLFASCPLFKRRRRFYEILFFFFYFININ